MPSKLWEVMNDLDGVTSKICSAREIIDNAIDKIQEHQYDKAELLMSAAYEYLEYYLQEFDDKFQLAWKETVNKQKDKVKKWILPVQETKLVDTDETEYFVAFPDDLLETANLKEGDQVEWSDNGDGSFTLKKVTQSLGMDEC